MNRRLTYILRAVMDEGLPAFIRDNRVFMYPLFWVWFKGQNIRSIMEFKSRFHTMSDQEFGDLYRTVATGIFNGTVGTTITTYSFSGGSCVAGQSAPQTELGVFELSPYIIPLTNYGFGFAFNAGLNPTNSCKPDGTLVTNPPGGTVQADPVTLVNSPVAGVCFACHDSPIETAHIQLNGGSLYAPRSTALTTVETCLICHGTGAIADIAVVHAP